MEMNMSEFYRMTGFQVHGYFLYVIIGLVFVWPLIIMLIHLFKISSPNHRKGLYFLGLLMPVASFMVYQYFLAKRCQDEAFLWFCDASVIMMLFLIPIIGIILLRVIFKVVYVEAFKQHHLKIGVTNEDFDQKFKLCCALLKMPVPRYRIVNQKGMDAVAMGIVKPVVFIHKALVENLNTAEMNMVLLHELVHIKKKDTTKGFCMYLFRDLMFFNPISTIILKQYMVERERLCDEEVVSLTGDKKFYLRTLLKVWEMQLEMKLSKKSFGLMAHLTSQQKTMTYRIESLMQTQASLTVQPIKITVLIYLMVVLSTLYITGLVC
jgi:beta-lactamase regulating signal transducer with metallopeptidase domain